MKIRASLLVLLVVMLGDVRWASAQATLQQVRVEEDNGRLNFWLPPGQRPDQNYTQGALIDGVSNAVPRWLRFGATPCVEARDDGTACAQLRFEIAQRMFTPDYTAFGPERPYAGVLDGEIERRSVTPRRRYAIGVLAGVTGPPSGAQPVQDWWHQRFGFGLEPGWEYQTSTQALANVAAHADWLLTPSNRTWITITGGTAAATGSLLTSASLVTEARLGLHVPHPWYPDESARPRWRAYAIVGSQLDAIARSLVIDGNNQWTLGRVQRIPFVPQTVWGGAVGFGAYNVVYRATSRGAEYHGAGRWHEWSSIALVYGKP